MRKRIVGWLVLAAIGWAGVGEAGGKTSNQFFYKPSVGARGSNEKSLFDAGLDAADAHLGSYKTLGDPGYATLAEALTTIGAQAVSLHLPAGTVNLTSNTTIPANVHLVVQQGALLAIANGITLTINGPLSAGRYAIFSCSGSGTLAGDPKIDHVYPEWFGAQGDGSTNDFAAVDKCLQVAQVWQKPVKFRQAVYKLNTKLTPVDIAKTQLWGDSTVLDFSGLAAAGVDHYALQLYSSTDYVGRWRNRKTALQGLTLLGAWSSGGIKDHTGLALGHASYAENSCFAIRDCVFQGFRYNVRFLQNAWLVSLLDCQVRWGGLYTAPGLSNMGAKLEFTNCFFSDSAGYPLTLGTGSYYFRNCAFDNSYPEIVGDVSAVLRDCHLENSGAAATSGYWLNLNSVNGYALLDGCQLFFNEPAGNFTNALLRVHDGNAYRGLHLRNLWVNNLWSKYVPETNSGHRVLVEGLGRVSVDNVNTWWSGGAPYAIAQYPNRLYNSGLETGNLTGWTSSGTGTVSASTAQKKNGSYSLLLQANAGQNPSVYQEFQAQPGQHVTVSFWEMRAAMGTGSTSCQFVFYDAKGDDVTGDQSNYSVRNTVNPSWACLSMGALVPKGAVKGRILFQAASTSGTTTVYLDDIIANVY